METTCVCTSVRKPQNNLSDFNKIQFGCSLKKKNLSRKLEFRENRLGENHTLLKGINEFLSLLLMFLNRFMWNLVWEISAHIGVGKFWFSLNSVRWKPYFTIYTAGRREGGGGGGGGGGGRCWIFRDFLFFRPNCIKFGTQAISTWIYRMLVSFVKAGINEFINSFPFLLPVVGGIR